MQSFGQKDLFAIVFIKMGDKMRETNNIPKVLVISYSPFSKIVNNGKTLSSFFENYSREFIAQFCFSGGDRVEDVCDNYYILTNDDVLRKKTGNAYSAFQIPVIPVNQEKKTGLKKVFGFFSQKRSPAAVYIKNYVWGRADYSKAFEWIDQFDPDVVFFQGFSMAYGYDFALEVCERKNIPMILELTDDYTHRLYPLSILEKANQTRYRKAFTKALRFASKTIVISQLMKEEYESRFGGDMVVMMNSVNVLHPACPCGRTPNDYVYAGNLLLNRWKVLRNLGKALLQVNPQATLNIYTPDVPPKRILKALSKVRSIRYGGKLTKEELECRLKTCEYVVHVEAFDKKNRKITRLSMSTKISEYVASGAKVLAIGPSDVASMRCLDANRLGVCINSPSVKLISKALSCNAWGADYASNASAFIQSCAASSNGEQIKKIIMNAIEQAQRK